MNQRNTILAGTLFGCVAVIVGAFGAHALKEILATKRRVDTYEIADRYQIYH